MAITAVVLYSMDLATGNGLYCDTGYYTSYGYAVTSPPEQMRRTEICVQYKYLNQVMFIFFSFCVGSNDQSWGSYFSLWFHKLLVIQSYCMNQIFCKSTPSRLGGHIFKKYVTIGLYIYNSIRAVLLWIKNGEVLELYYFRLK